MKTLLATAALGVALPFAVNAETFTCPARDSACVIASITKANANGPDHDMIVLDPGTYILESVNNSPGFFEHNGLPIITTAMTIHGKGGQGRTLLTRKGDGPYFRLFDIAPTGGLTLSGLTLSRGELDLETFNFGGCIRNKGSLILFHMTIRECAAWIGGGLYNVGEVRAVGTLFLENFGEFLCGGICNSGSVRLEGGSWVYRNTALKGGGISNGGVFLIDRSVVMQNIATSDHGGGYQGTGALTVTHSLFMENTTQRNGGALSIEADGSLTMTNSTCWGNHATSSGGCLSVMGGQADLQSVAMLYNTAGEMEQGFGDGGGIFMNEASTITLAQSWLLYNEAGKGRECYGAVRLTGWNVIGTPNQFHRQAEPACRE